MNQDPAQTNSEAGWWRAAAAVDPKTGLLFFLEPQGKGQSANPSGNGVAHWKREGTTKITFRTEAEKEDCLQLQLFPEKEMQLIDAVAGSKEFKAEMDMGREDCMQPLKQIAHNVGKLSWHIWLLMTQSPKSTCQAIPYAGQAYIQTLPLKADNI